MKMERQLRRKYSNVPLERNRLGCMSGIFQIFYFHQRLNAQKTLPDKKRWGRRQPTGVQSPRTAGGHDFTVGDVNSYHIEDTQAASPTSKISGKTSIKKLVAEEMSKEDEQKQQIAGFAARLLRTNSIHHLECTDYELDGKTSICDNPTFEHSHDLSISESKTHDPFLPKHPEEQMNFNKQCDVCGAVNRSLDYLDSNKRDGRVNQLFESQTFQEELNEPKEGFGKPTVIKHRRLAREVFFHRSKEYFNPLDVYNEKGGFFIKILQDPNAIMVKRSPNRDAVLTKCGSFPTTEFSDTKGAGLIKIKQKEKAIQSFAKQEDKSQDSMETTSSIIKSTEDSNSESSTELKKQKQTGKVMKRLKDIKQRIKHAIKEGKKEGIRISMDAIFHKIPYGRKASKDTKSNPYVARFDNPNSGSGGARATFSTAPIRIKRTPSLTESLDRYSQLLESISSRDERTNIPEKPKLANDDGGLRERRSPKTFQRILSLPEGSYILGRELHSDLFQDVLHRRSSRKSIDANAYAEKCTRLDPLLETESLENYVENISFLDGDQPKSVLDTCASVNPEGVGTGEVSALEENKDTRTDVREIGSLNKSKNELAQESPMSVLYSEIHPGHIDFNEQAGNLNLGDVSNMDCRNSLEANANVDELQNHDTLADFDSHYFQMDITNDGNFNFVRDVLKRSGFSGNEILGTWHSPNQPVDPSLFNEVECARRNPDIIGLESSCDQQLLFDLINEVLLEIYERSFTYCPWLLSSNSNLRPLPVGRLVLDEVWASIRWHLSPQVDRKFSLESTMARDFAKNDGWMHLQQEAECVGVELEDWIIDDLLDEVTFDLASS